MSVNGVYLNDKLPDANDVFKRYWIVNEILFNSINKRKKKKYAYSLDINRKTVKSIEKTFTKFMKIKNSNDNSNNLHSLNITKYEGNIKGSMVKSMVQEVLANNMSDNASDETTVAITGEVTLSTTDTTPTYNTDFKTTKTYTVTLTYNDSGRVSSIDVQNK